MLGRWKPHEIDYRDLVFERRLVRWPNPSGGSRLRWLDIGMPKISQELANAVFYAFGADPKTGKIGPVGTGFLVCRSFKDNPALLKNHYYAVSNRHVVHAAGGNLIRINTKDNKSRKIQTAPDEWAFVKDGDDVAIADITDRLNLETDEISAVHEMRFVDETILWANQIGIGEDVFMLGFFVSHGGAKRNAPSARFGNVSRLADPDNPVKQPHGVFRPSHLIDIRSRTGFSGSPVFVYRTLASDLTYEFTHALRASRTGGVMIFTEEHHFLKLFGIHCSQFRDVLTIKEGKITESFDSEMQISERSDEAIKDGDKLYIPSSMTIVIPAWRITETLNLPDLDKMRKRRELEDDDTSIPQPEAAATENGAEDANPNHLKDFTRLVDVAARKKPKD